MQRRTFNAFSHYLLMTMIIAGAWASVGAGQAARFKVTVEDKLGALVPDTSITLLSPEVIRTGRTAEDGVLVLESLPEGSYDLEVVHAGFKKLTKLNIPIEKNQAFELTLTLEVSPSGDCGKSGSSIFYEPRPGKTTLTGRFYDRWNDSFGNARFKLTLSGEGKTLRSTSSQDGSFQFNGLAPGRYKLAAQSSDYSMIPDVNILIVQGNLARIELVVTRKFESRVAICE